MGQKTFSFPDNPLFQNLSFGPAFLVGVDWHSRVVKNKMESTRCREKTKDLLFDHFSKTVGCSYAAVS